MGNCLERRNRVRSQPCRSSEASPRYCPDLNEVILGNANGLAVVLTEELLTHLAGANVSRFNVENQTNCRRKMVSS